MSEISSTSGIINKIFNSKLDNEIMENFRTFSQQILLRQRIIKNEFFEVNWTLLQQVKYF